jgi:hypothetical protein
MSTYKNIHHENKNAEASTVPAAASSGSRSALQLKDNRPGNVIQKKKNNTGLPDQLKTGIENLSGQSMDDVKVHYQSGRPAQLQAHAFAQGNQIHLAPGQEKHLPHEAWHVAQQKQGRVKPTTQLKGMNINNEGTLEKEADVNGAKALSYSGSSEKTILRKASSPPVVQGVFGLLTDSLYSLAGTTGKVLKQVGDVGKYALDTVKDPLLYAKDGVMGSVKHVGSGVAGIAGHGWRGLKGTMGHTWEGVKGTAGYLADTVTGPLKFAGGIPEAITGRRSAIRMVGGRPVRMPGRRGGVRSLAAHVGGGILGGGVHVLKGLIGPVMHTARGIGGILNYGKDAVVGTGQYLDQGYQGTKGYLRRGAVGIGSHIARGARGIRDNVGYFRAASMGLGALGAGAAMMMNMPAKHGMALGASLPYLYDMGMHLKMKHYQWTHPGYHSIEKHSAWHSSGNMKNRLRHTGGGQTRMRNWMFQRVGQGPASGQFKTENWHLYSIKEAEKRLRILNPLAVIINNRPVAQIPGHRFTIEYPGWDTGISHSPATPAEGVATAYVFSNFISPVGLPNQYFLVQHYPQAMAAANNFVVNTWRPV